jgi:dTDP-4-dehydrorhamnose reductase
MKKNRLLITGGTGLLALNWACAMRNTWDVTLGTHSHSVNLAGVNSCPLMLNNPAYLERQIDALAPDLVVHTAGLTNVDKCELSPELAHQANVVTAQNMALAAAQHGFALIHVSTDHLFGGSQSMRSEQEVPLPINHYGRTKALAEVAVMNANPAALVLRTNFFGWGHSKRHSFSDWLIYNLRAGKELPLYDNIFFTPILADALAMGAHQLVERGASGIFNLVGDQRLSKYDFARMLTDHFSLPKHLIQRRRLDCSELLAARPHDMSLDNRKACEALGQSLGDVPQFLAALRDQETSGRCNELLKSVT